MSLLTTARVIASGDFSGTTLTSHATVTDHMVADAAASTGEWVLCVCVGEPAVSIHGAAETAFEQLNNASFLNEGANQWAPQQTGSFQAVASGEPWVCGTYLERLAAPIAIGDSIDGVWQNLTAFSQATGARSYLVIAFATSPDMHGMVSYYGAGDPLYDGFNDDDDSEIGMSSTTPSTAMPHSERAGGPTVPGAPPPHGYSFAQIAIIGWLGGSTAITDPGAPWEPMGKYGGVHGIAAYIAGPYTPNTATDYSFAATLSAATDWAANISDWMTETPSPGAHAWYRAGNRT